VYLVGNDGTNQKLSVKGDGSFTKEIQTGVDYVMLGTCKGYLNHKEELRVDTATVSKEYVLQFPLANISAPVLIENIFYDFDKATLRPESQTALDQLVKLLNDNPNVTIELSAHTDYKGSDQYNEGLSQRRAESVVNYLIEHGIAADRLTPKGYGEGKPKTIKRKVAEKYPFLKEGDVLTEEFIMALKDEEQQEQCCQLNRRTEFIVLRTTYGLFDEEGKLKNLPKPKEQEESDSQEDDDWF
jgi:outer membrane protein OmpA-like peptidoglycan-associated protein